MTSPARWRWRVATSAFTVALTALLALTTTPSHAESTVAVTGEAERAAGTIDLSGTLLRESDGVTTTYNEYVDLMADGSRVKRIFTYNGVYAFRGLEAGREYSLRVEYGSQFVYAADIPTLDPTRARTFTETTADIRLVTPKPAVITGTVRADYPGLRYQVTAFTAEGRPGERIEVYPYYDRGYWLDLFPGRYVIRANDVQEPTTVNDVFYPNGAHLDEGEPIEVRAGERLEGIDFTLPTRTEPTPSVTRLQGVDRYATSAAISASAFTPGVPVLYLASGANWPDALSAGPAAAVRRGALLLTEPNRLPEVIQAEIERLQPERVIIVGSEASVSDAVSRQVSRIVPDVTRLGGVDRYDTSRLIVEEAFPSSQTVYLATGTGFADALSGASAAGRKGWPVLLVDGSQQRLDEASVEAMQRLAPTDVQVLGSAASVSAAIEDDIANRFEWVSRFDGVDRFHTNYLVNDASAPPPFAERVFIANAHGFADALAASAAAAALQAPVLFSPGDCMSPRALAYVNRHEIDRVVLLGAEPSLGASVERLHRCAW